MIYLSPRTKSGFYGAISYTPKTVRPASFTIADNASGTTGSLAPSLAGGQFRDVVQAAFVWNHRTELLDLTIGAT